MTTIEKNQFIPDVLGSLFTGVVEGSENRISHLLFKMIVEQNMLMRIVSTQFEFEDDSLDKLRGLAIEDVKRSNGNISLKDINKNFDAECQESFLTLPHSSLQTIHPKSAL